MRILFHHRTLADGAEGVHIAAMVEAFRVLGHDVRVTGLAAAEEGRRPTLLGRLRAALPHALLEIAAIASNGFEFAATLRDIRRFKPDLLYKRHARFDIGALSAGRRTKTPSVLEVNCLFSQPPYVVFEPLAFRATAVRMERRALQLADAVIAVSSPLARTARGLAGVDVSVVPNGADPQRFDPSRADGSRIRGRYPIGDRLVIGWIGVLRDWHGIDMLLDAVAQLPSAYLLVVGDGPGRQALEDRALGAGLEDRFTVTGRIAHDEMPHYIAAMDVAVVADERTGVASPMKLLEYMAMGKATIAPDMDNIKDVITDRVNGLLFRAGDSADLRERLRELIGDPALRAALGTRARQTVEAGRNWRQIAVEVLALAASRHAETPSMPVAAR